MILSGQLMNLIHSSEVQACRAKFGILLFPTPLYAHREVHKIDHEKLFQRTSVCRHGVHPRIQVSVSLNWDSPKFNSNQCNISLHFCFFHFQTTGQRNWTFHPDNQRPNHPSGLRTLSLYLVESTLQRILEDHVIGLRLFLHKCLEGKSLLSWTNG
jgi:hypothetical protein